MLTAMRTPASIVLSQIRRASLCWTLLLPSLEIGNQSDPNNFALLHPQSDYGSMDQDTLGNLDHPFNASKLLAMIHQ